MSEKSPSADPLVDDLTTLIKGVLWAWLPDIGKATRGLYSHLDVAGDCATTVAEYIRARDANA